jgi:hypothetical protein
MDRCELLEQILQDQQAEITKISGLQDHKGILSVNWRDYPTEQERKRIETLWDVVFFECEVDHYHRSRPIGPVTLAGAVGPFFEEERQ